jgi:hypothetical protein
LARLLSRTAATPLCGSGGSAGLAAGGCARAGRACAYAQWRDCYPPASLRVFALPERKIHSHACPYSEEIKYNVLFPTLTPMLTLSFVFVKPFFGQSTHFFIFMFAKSVN